MRVRVSCAGNCPFYACRQYDKSPATHYSLYLKSVSAVEAARGTMGLVLVARRRNIAKPMSLRICSPQPADSLVEGRKQEVICDSIPVSPEVYRSACSMIEPKSVAHIVEIVRIAGYGRVSADCMDGAGSLRLLEQWRGASIDSEHAVVRRELPTQRRRLGSLNMAASV